MLMRAAPKAHARGQPQAQGHIHGHGRGVYRAAQAIRAEETFSHEQLLLNSHAQAQAIWSCGKP